MNKIDYTYVHVIVRFAVVFAINSASNADKQRCAHSGWHQPPLKKISHYKKLTNQH